MISQDGLLTVHLLLPLLLVLQAVPQQAEHPFIGTGVARRLGRRLPPGTGTTCCRRPATFLALPVIRVHGRLPRLLRRGMNARRFRDHRMDVGRRSVSCLRLRSVIPLIIVRRLLIPGLGRRVTVIRPLYLVTILLRDQGPIRQRDRQIHLLSLLLLVESLRG